MTGGTRGPDGPGPGPAGPDTSGDCKHTYKGARLSSPKNLSKIVQGEWLNLAVRDINGAPVLFALTRMGVELGAITSRSTAEIVSCINRGYLYGAQVTTLDGGDCSLTILLKDTP